MTNLEEAHLDKMSRLLAIERKQEYEYYKDKIKHLPIPKRKEQGFTWYPVQVIKTGYTYGSRAYVTVERSDHLDENHQFRGGKVVNLFSQRENLRNPEQSAVVHFVERNKMKIILNTDLLPDWIEQGSIGIDLLFDERSYIEMGKALTAIKQAKNDRPAELRALFLGTLTPRFGDIVPVKMPMLNESQNAAIAQALAAKDFALIHGPPGTGKTTTLVQLIRLICESESTVLVCAPSNTAVDVLTERLAKHLRVVRIGNISRVTENLIAHTLDGQLAAHPDSKHIKKVKIEATATKQKAQKYKRQFGEKERRERRRLNKQARELSTWANQLEERLIDNIISDAQAICCTLISATNSVMANRRYKTVIIDEAAQALEPATWIPIMKGKRIILTGDPFQLPPTVKSREAQRQGFGITLLERSLNKEISASLLRMQYRMNELIMDFSNYQFYDGKLIAAPSVAHHTLPKDQQPISFIDTAGCSFDEQINPEYLSRFNPGEFNILCEHLYQLLAQLSEEDKLIHSIALISPYRQQVIYMQTEKAEDEKLSAIKMSIDTVDGFQGQERDIVYLSLVRSNSKCEIGFLSDYRRMNVAMTRARKKLVVIGDSATIGNDPFYSAFLDYCEKLGAYKSAWEYMK